VSTLAPLASAIQRREATEHSFTLTRGQRHATVEAVTDPEQSVFVVSEPG
jgi:hypothetical protein